MVGGLVIREHEVQSVNRQFRQQPVQLVFPTDDMRLLRHLEGSFQAPGGQKLRDDFGDADATWPQAGKNRIAPLFKIPPIS